MVGFFVVQKVNNKIMMWERKKPFFTRDSIKCRFNLLERKIT